jgi:hypothetical protein
LGDGFVKVLVFGLIGFSRCDNRGEGFFLFVVLLGDLNFLNDLFVLEINLVHFLGHFQFVFGKQLCPFHAFLNVALDLFFQEQLIFEDFLPRNSLLRFEFEHFFKEILELFVFEFLGELDDFFVDFGNEFFKT